MVSLDPGFSYSGVAPERLGDRRKGWTLADQLGFCAPGDPEYKPRRNAPLFGLAPTVRIDGNRLMIETTLKERDWAAVRAAALELDPWLIAAIQGGDLFSVART